MSGQYSTVNMRRRRERGERERCGRTEQPNGKKGRAQSSQYISAENYEKVGDLLRSWWGLSLWDMSTPVLGKVTALVVMNNGLIMIS